MFLLQLKVVIWKNFIIRKNHWILTFIEFVLPTLLFLLLAYVISLMCHTNDHKIIEATYTSPRVLEYDNSSSNNNIELYFAPNSSFYQDIIKRVQLKIPFDVIKGFSTSDSLVHDYEEQHNNYMYIIAIVFNGENRNKLDYTIRMDYSYFSIYITDQLYKGSFRFNPGFGTPYDKYLLLQKALDVSFVEKTSGKNLDNNVTIMIQEFPYPPHKVESIFNEIFITFLPIVTLLSFIFISPAVLKRVVEEKYTGTKELMKMVGMKPWMLWLGWFIHGMIPMLFSIICIVLLMKIPFFNNQCVGINESDSLPPIQYTDGSILFVFLLLYCMTAIVFCFAIGSLFNKPTIAVVAGILVWILSYFVPKYGLALDSTDNKLSWSLNMILNFFPNMALHYGYLTIFLYEDRDLGLQWNNFYKSSSEGTEDLSMLNIFVMLLVDIIFYMGFTLYMDRVNPGKFGTQKSFLFPIHFLVKFIKWPRAASDPQRIEHLPEDVLDYVEEGTGLIKGIEVRELVKQYGHKTAVDHLSLNIYQNQITVLLGHNGAGKSTTMCMITGMLHATSGTIKMSGKDIRNNMDEIRKSLGLCPQHNLLFSDLTVGEHLLLFAKLKGNTSKEANEEMLELLEKLNLSEKKNAMAHTLSGGMKRKLCLGMAVIGGSKILILDEPTSGMDPESRRELWDQLLAWRGEKTILITTHFMEEADALGDWIAIMANGKLQCHGTPIYLKKAFDTGYHLSLIVADSATVEERDVIKENIKQYIGCAKLKDCNGNNMIFTLPLEDNSKISGLLAFLEEKKEDLKIENMSVTVTTLEDVFLKVKTDSGIDLHEESEFDIQDDNGVTPSTLKLFIMRLTALIIKKIQFYRTKISIHLIPILIGIAIFILAVYLSGDLANTKEDEGREFEIGLSMYQRSTVFYNYTKQNNVITKMETTFKSLVETNKGDPIEVKDIEQTIIAKGMQNIIFYKEHLIASAQFNFKDKPLLTAWYSGIAIHSAPISLNLITNTLAKVHLGNQYSIETRIWPLPSLNQDPYVSERYNSTIVTILWAVLIPIGFVLIIGCFIVFPHTELATNFIQLQYMCGVKPYFYWLVNFFVDIMIYMIISLIMATVAALMAPYIGGTEFGFLFLILVMYGMANIPVIYIFSRKKSAAGGFASFVIMNIFLGIVFMVTVESLMSLGDLDHKKLGHGLKILFVLILPQVGLVHALFIFAETTVKNYTANIDCKMNPSPSEDDPCSSYKNYMPLLQEDILLLFLSSIMYIIINILLDTYLVKKAFSKIKFLILSNWHRYVMQRGNDNYVSQNFGNSANVEVCNSLQVMDLCKSYNGKRVVKNIGFTVKEKECLGLLGVNGAGKTTTFRILTGDEFADHGNVEIIYNKYKKPITINQSEYLENIGYCPQIDALNFALTGRQILTLMAKLRGVDHSELVNKFLKVFELDKYANMACGHYSGGNKRKLSLAVALIGFPKFILLDEPTNGVDPSSRRKFWNLIRIFKEKKDLCFILTSHSMVECEALCNYLKIMKDGRFEKEGTISDLKKRHGGFNVKLKLVNKNGQKDSITGEGSSNSHKKWTNMVQDAFNDIDEIKEYFRQNYSGTVKDEHAGLLDIHVEDKNMKWSTIFKIMERIKMRNLHLIEDYTISEASLEDIFLTVARSTKYEEKPKKKCKKEKGKMEPV